MPGSEYGDVYFTFTVNDNVTATTEQMVATQSKFEGQVDKSTASVDRQNMSFLVQMEAARGLYRGVSMLSRSAQQLGLISEGAAMGLMKVQAGLGLVVGAYSMLKASAKIVESLRTATVGLAVVESYRKVLANPAAIALVIGGAAAAGGLAGYFVGQGNQQQTVNQTVNFNGMQTQANKDIAMQSMDVMGGF